MNPVAHHPSFAPLSHGAPDNRTMQTEQTRAASVSQSHNTDLTIMTKEGDTVTLSLAASAEINAGIHRNASATEGSAAASQTAYFDFSNSREMTMAVEGHLNPEELADIREAVEAIGGMIEEFLEGDFEEMAEEAEELKGLETLSGLQAAFSYERQVIYAQQDRVQVNQVATDPDHQIGRGPGQLAQRIDRLADEMLQPVERFQGRRGPLMRTISHLFDHFHRVADEDDKSEEQLQHNVLEALQSSFFQKMTVLTQSVGFDLTYSA